LTRHAELVSASITPENQFFSKKPWNKFRVTPLIMINYLHSNKKFDTAKTLNLRLSGFFLKRSVI